MQCLGMHFDINSWHPCPHLCTFTVNLEDISWMKLLLGFILYIYFFTSKCVELNLYWMQGELGFKEKRAAELRCIPLALVGCQWSMLFRSLLSLATACIWLLTRKHGPELPRVKCDWNRWVVYPTQYKPLGERYDRSPGKPTIDFDVENPIGEK